MLTGHRQTDTHMHTKDDIYYTFVLCFVCLFVFFISHTYIHAGSEYLNLASAVIGGYLSEDELDVSVVRLMRGFIMLGVLDPPDMVPYNT